MAKTKAEQFLNSLGSEIAPAEAFVPVNLPETLVDCGIRLCFDGELDEEIMAKLEIVGQKKTLRLNPLDNPYRFENRYLVAHVLGHYALHCQPGADYIIVERRRDFHDFSKRFWPGVEQEAAAFANDLLLPVEACRLVAKKFWDKSQDQPSCEREHFWRGHFASIFEVNSLYLGDRLRLFGLM
ncbi:ImmA/IrrE family metallo-endopeptidase [Acidithiobacillus ferrooxidans]|uniref:ImmA/IrrE family metallo-endopeptidase n=1 Tax=Acidithiobacillus ferrooxidans TaxID=920 RepID=UPI002147E0EA|nr:ImmA/IrrE family metallo-endopeptidase [Acidithiobacillus ferrooxidans]MCR1345365.1 ImmA/IrrE family metallo-endopeptidase [Acidithiobacillus ferrooxidans]MCR1354525.1 ImmA/IrrE family metallo-endopeptidase [Acidithiobacillus ferrooxidans]